MSVAKIILIIPASTEGGTDIIPGRLHSGSCHYGVRTSAAGFTPGDPVTEPRCRCIQCVTFAESLVLLRREVLRDVTLVPPQHLEGRGQMMVLQDTAVVVQQRHVRPCVDDGDSDCSSCASHQRPVLCCRRGILCVMGLATCVLLEVVVEARVLDIVYASGNDACK
eukprot:scaffold182_cov350-Prasinococcus_capsulatus_cf.AAC.12